MHFSPGPERPPFFFFFFLFEQQLKCEAIMVAEAASPDPCLASEAIAFCRLRPSAKAADHFSRQRAAKRRPPKLEFSPRCLQKERTDWKAAAEYNTNTGHRLLIQAQLKALALVCTHLWSWIRGLYVCQLLPSSRLHNRTPLYWPGAHKMAFGAPCRTTADKCCILVEGGMH